MQSGHHHQIEKICLVGLGPTGLSFLASMLEKAPRNPNKTYEITVIEKRNTQFSRNQRLIDIGTTEVSGGWEPFLIKLLHLENSVSTGRGIMEFLESSVHSEKLNARQKFLRKLFRQTLAASHCRSRTFKNFSIQSLQKALMEHIETEQVSNVSINWHTEATISKVNLTDKSVTIVEKEGSESQHQFDTFVICEGSKREVTNQINAAIVEEKIDVQPFQFEIFPYQLPRFNVSCFFTIALPDEFSKLMEYRIKSDLDIKKLQNDALEKLQELGWTPTSEKISHPISILDTNLYKENLEIEDWKSKVYLVSELPEKIARIPDPHLKNQKMKEWLMTLASYRLQLPENLLIIKEDELMIFETEASFVVNPILNLPNESQIILLGDCSMSPIYQAGISSNIGLGEAEVAAACIVDDAMKSSHCFAPFILEYRDYQRKISGKLEKSIYSTFIGHSSLFSGQQQSAQTQNKNDSEKKCSLS